MTGSVFMWELLTQNSCIIIEFNISNSFQYLKLENSVYFKYFLINLLKIELYWLKYDFIYKNIIIFGKWMESS